MPSEESETNPGQEPSAFEMLLSRKTQQGLGLPVGAVNVAGTATAVQVGQRIMNGTSGKVNKGEDEYGARGTSGGRGDLMRRGSHGVLRSDSLHTPLIEEQDL